jgi:hypothetical protein
MIAAKGNADELHPVPADFLATAPILPREAIRED